jgi:hypothetical protein
MKRVLYDAKVSEGVPGFLFSSRGRLHRSSVILPSMAPLGVARVQLVASRDPFWMISCLRNMLLISPPPLFSLF